MDALDAVLDLAKLGAAAVKELKSLYRVARNTEAYLDGRADECRVQSDILGDACCDAEDVIARLTERASLPDGTTPPPVQCKNGMENSP